MKGVVPHVCREFREKMQKYDDADTKFRKKMIRSVPYLKQLDDSIIQEIMYLLKPMRYEEN
jgi:hypothetical protein